MRFLLHPMNVPAIIILCLACLGFAGGATHAETLFVVTTDYESGGHSVLDTQSFSASTHQGTIFQDAVVRSFGDNVYVVERWHGDNILIYHKNNLEKPVRQFSVGSGTNPHDFLLLSETRAYVTLYEESELLIVNPQTGLRTGSIDLSAYADADGIPEMDLMIRYGDYVFVSLQRLDRTRMFQPTGTSAVVVIDLRTDTIVDTDPRQPGTQAIELTRTNPVDMQYVAATGKILVAEAGSYYTTDDGGLEFVDPVALTGEGVLMTEAELGGQIGGAFGALTMTDSDQGYAIIMTEDWLESRVVRFNIETRSARAVHAPNSGFVHSDILLRNDLLYVCDRTRYAPGIRIFDTRSDNEITSQPIETGLPPFCLTAIGADDMPTGVPGSSVPDNDTQPEESMQFVTAVLSNSDMPVFTDVFVFNADGSFVLKKFEQYGSGDFYYITPTLVHFIFNNGAAVDIQYIQGTGIVLNGLTDRLIFGAGSYMIDYSIFPMLFAGREVMAPQ